MKQRFRVAGALVAAAAFALAACSSADESKNTSPSSATGGAATTAGGAATTAGGAATTAGGAATTAGGAATTAAGSTAGSGTVQLTQGGNVTIEVVTHGQASDPFWSVVKKGVDDAAKVTGAKVNYSAPATFDMVQMSQLIDAAVAKKPDGLVVSVPDYDALKTSLAAATAAGIPIVTMNSGSDHFQEIGAITHVGQDETIAGEGAGKRLAEAGAKNVVCVNQEVGNAALDARCAGAKSEIEKAGGKMSVLQVDLNDAAGAQQTISSAIQSDSSIDAVLTLGPTGAAPALAALTDLGKVGKIKLATFDLSPAVVDAIAKGDMLFAVDQQQYLQGYLPIIFLDLYVKNLNTVGGGLPVLTGPGFVTKDNAARIKALAAAGTR
jgi:simple sugar transport system substrate-binding protein